LGLEASIAAHAMSDLFFSQNEFLGSLKIKQRLTQDVYGIMEAMSGLGDVAEHCI